MRSSRVIACAIAGALVVAACGGSSGDSTAETRTRNAVLVGNDKPVVLVKDVAALGQSALVRLDDDTVRVIGPNTHDMRSITNAVAGKKIAKMAAGFYNAAVLDSDGALYVSGYYAENFSLSLPPGATKWVDLALAADFIVAIADNGQLRTGGHGTPFVMPTLTNGGTKFVKVAAGWAHFVFLDDNGNVYKAGYNFYGQLNLPALRAGGTKFVDIAANFYSTGLLDDKGNAYLFGWELTGAPIPALTGGGTKFTSLALGTKHAVLLDDKGTTYHTGETFENMWTLPAGTTITKVAAGPQFTLGLDERGVLHQASAASNTYRGVFTQTAPVLPVAASGNTTVAIGEDGKIVRLGEGFSAEPPTSTDIVSVGVGLNHGLGLTAQGRVRGWGNDQFGQIGQGTDATELVKVVGGPAWSAGLTRYGTVVGWGTGAPISSSRDGLVRDIVAGHNHTTMLLTNGTVFSSGSLSMLAPPPMPHPSVSISSDYVRRLYRAIAASGECSVALGAPSANSASGKPHFVGWGQCAPEILAAPDLSDAQSIAIGAAHGAAIKRDGSVVAWGDNTLGQRNVPAGLSDAVLVVAGDNHTVVVDAKGRVWAWGDNSFGQTDIPESLRLSSSELATALEARNNAVRVTPGVIATVTQMEQAIASASDDATASASGDAPASASGDASASASGDASALAALLNSWLPADAPEAAAELARVRLPIEVDLSGKVPASKTPTIKRSSSVSAARALTLLRIKGAQKPSFVVTKRPKSSPCSVTKSAMTARKRGVCSAVVTYTDSKGKKSRATFAILITS